MQTDDNLSLEGDWPDRTSETGAPAQPMVVIHYRNRGVPLWVLIPLILLVPIGGILVYHRFFVEADRADAAQARRALQDKIAGKRIEPPIQVAVEPPAAAAAPAPSTSTLNSQPIVPSSSTPTAAISPPASPSPSPAATTPLLSQPKPQPPVAADAAPPADSALHPQTVASRTDQSPVQSNSIDSVAISKETATPPATVADVAAGNSTTKELEGRSTSARNEPEIPVARGQDQPAMPALSPSPPAARTNQPAGLTPGPRAEDASRLVAARDSAPVLPRQKSARQLQQEEAASKQAEIEARVYEDRVKFREGLKDALALNINRGGAEIDKLSRRYGQDRDPEKFAQARQAWFYSRTSAQAKVRLIRSLGLPESVILDFLSAQLHPHIGTRGGPRDTNEVRVRAAKLLLSYDLPAPPAAIAAADRASLPDEAAKGEGLTGATWPFLPERDTFRPNALLDLRGLNEKVAGQSGFVRQSADGESFVLGDGTPVRFWGVSTDARKDLIVEEAAHHARFLAKRGVNMVRWYRPFYSQAKNARIGESDAKSIDATWKFIAAMKKEGIYVTLCTYWSGDTRPGPAWRSSEGWPEKETPWGLLFFNPSLQKAYKSWLKALLSRPNPYTGVPLANEPAVAVVEIQNEDSLLFFTAQNIKGKQAEVLGRQFGDWLKTKYGTLDGAFRAWGNVTVKEDRPAQGVVGLLLVWEWTQPRDGGRKKRLDDQLQFFAETMYRFNREIERYLHEELGCKQLVNANNWRSVDAIKTGDAERWTYTANEVLAVNRYYSAVHLGPTAGWRIDPGDTFEDVSVMLRPRDLPVNIKQASGHTMMVTESHWVPPLSYQSEGPFLVAAYQSLNGVDVLDWAATSEPEWSSRDRAEWDSASRAKWQIATPMILGQFPAAALLFRKGYVKQGRPVVEEHRALGQIWERVPPLIAEDPGYDPNRDLGDSAQRPGQSGSVDPLAFLVGPIKVHYDSDPSKTKVADLRNFIDHDRKVVRGNTGQVSLDFGHGLCTIDAPQAQGASGFLKDRGPVELSTVSLTSENPYASVLVVSMDGEILSRSKHVLVQVGTRARPTDWVEREAKFTAGHDQHTVIGKRVVSTGRMPWAVENTNVTLEIKNPGLRKATSLDLNGNARGALKVADSGGAAKLTLPPDALYVILASE